MQNMPQVWSTSQQYVTRKAKVNTCLTHSNQGKPKAQQLWGGALYTLHDADSSEYASEREDTFCLQMKIHRTRISHPEVPKPVYLMANLAYHLQEHHQRNQYLQARLDTCADVKFNANGSVLSDVQRPRAQEAHPFQYGN